jgi:hypothetical protein
MIDQCRKPSKKQPGLINSVLESEFLYKTSGMGWWRSINAHDVGEGRCGWRSPVEKNREIGEFVNW